MNEPRPWFAPQGPLFELLYKALFHEIACLIANISPWTAIANCIRNVPMVG